MSSRPDVTAKIAHGILGTWLLLMLSFCAATRAEELTCRHYRDSHGHEILLHPRAFADRVVCPGGPNCTNKVFEIPGLHNSPENALGPPSYYEARGKGVSRGIYSLGCRGWAIWEFTDNLIVDVPGPDLIVFEVGRSSEATSVEVSDDGTNWIDVGVIAGRRSSLDISPFVTKNQTFRFIRLTDLATSCKRGDRTPGADIDAIATYAFSWMHIEDDTSIVFFDFAEARLKPEAKQLLDRLFATFKDLRNYRLQIAGHTDGIGTHEDNHRLSEKRAEAVADYLVSTGALTVAQVASEGAGKTRPLLPNTTPANRARNRRVELTFVPLVPCR